MSGTEYSLTNVIVRSDDGKYTMIIAIETLGDRNYQDILDRLGIPAKGCLMVGNDATEDTAAAKAGLDVFLLTDCLINTQQQDISRYPHGGFDELMAYIHRQMA